MSLDVHLNTVEGIEVYSDNITHNLNKMAKEAGIYDCLWRPLENGYTEAGQLIELLEEGLKKLQSNPEYYKRFNPENGWGSYEILVEFVQKYLEACEKYPDAEIYVSR